MVYKLLYIQIYDIYNIQLYSIRVHFFSEAKASKVCTRFVMKNHLTATYSYIRDENSSTGCTSIHDFCKML